MAHPLPPGSPRDPREGRGAAGAAVDDVMTGEPDPLREALVAVDPKTGAVRAYYGGSNGAGPDYALAQRQPGSSMKPYALAAAVDQGIGVMARRDGSNDQEFEDREAPVVNSGGVSCGSCTLREAMTRSLNTTFYGLALEVGPGKVRETALAATGLPETRASGNLAPGTVLANTDGVTGGAIGIGEYEMRPIDQAVGFATFASGGIQRDPYFVARVTDSEGTVLLDNALASMGAGLAAAMSAKMVHPDRRVMAICGDGGFMMNSQDMETAVRLGLDLVILLIRDDGYGFIRWKQAGDDFPDFGMDFGNPDFVAYAEAYGAKGFVANGPAEVEATLKKALTLEAPVLIEVPVGPMPSPFFKAP